MCKDQKHVLHNLDRTIPAGGIFRNPREMQLWAAYFIPKTVCKARVFTRFSSMRASGNQRPSEPTGKRSTVCQDMRL